MMRRFGINMILSRVSFMVTIALTFSGCAKDAGLPAQEPAQYTQLIQPEQYAQVIVRQEKPAGKKIGNDVIEIKEKMFIAQTNEIYINAKDYIGRTIKYEGIFREAVDEGDGKKYRYVIRYGPGCCPGDVTAAGFEVVWDKGYPKQDDWVEVTGVLEEYNDGGPPSLRIALKTLTVLTTRGKDRVTR